MTGAVNPTPAIEHGTMLPDPPARAGADRLLVIASDQTPEGALTWATSAEKSRQLRLWRRACARKFTTSTRPVRLALVMGGLFSDAGFCFASNGHLASETGMPTNKVQEALLEMEREGAVIRATTSLKDPAGRRIYPSQAIVTELGGTPNPGGAPPPPDRRLGGPPTSGVRNLRKGSGPSRNRISVADAARIEADRRDARERGETQARWCDDP